VTAEEQQTGDAVDGLREALKSVAVALKESGASFALAGGYAAWAHGSPEPLHDVDFLVRPEDAAELSAELQRAGFEVVDPPEDWLFKVRLHGVVVDIIHRASGSTVDEALAAAADLEVLSVVMPVLSATDVTTQKLLALDEHSCDLSSILSTARALREQVDWSVVRHRVSGAPFAETALFLLERLDILHLPDATPDSSAI
jgi:hypothetical protein